MRKEKNGWPPKVKVGFGTNRKLRGLNPRGLEERLVLREAELERLDPKVHVVRISGRLGERKRVSLIQKARELNLRVLNPGKEEARPVEEGETAVKTASEPSEKTVGEKAEEAAGETAEEQVSSDVPPGVDETSLEESAASEESQQ